MFKERVNNILQQVQELGKQHTEIQEQKSKYEKSITECDQKLREIELQVEWFEQHKGIGF